MRDDKLGINMHTLKALFLAAVDKDPPQRAAFLDEACGSDLALRREVETLLELHRQANRFLEVPAVQQLAGRRSRSAVGAVETSEARTQQSQGSREISR
jgi:DNA-binding transcriptional regulator YbjK